MSKRGKAVAANGLASQPACDGYGGSEPGGGSDGQVAVPAHERERMIAVAAYFIAERRGFAPGVELDDWLQAEAEVDREVR